MLLAGTPYAHSDRTFDSDEASAAYIAKSSAPEDYDDDEKSAQASDDGEEWDEQDQAKSTQSECESVSDALSQLDEEQLVNSEEFARGSCVALGAVPACHQRLPLQ